MLRGLGPHPLPVAFHVLQSLGDTLRLQTVRSLHVLSGTFHTQHEPQPAHPCRAALSQAYPPGQAVGLSCFPRRPAVCSWAGSLALTSSRVPLLSCKRTRYTASSLTSPIHSVQFSSVPSLSHVQLFATPWTAARQPSPSITNSRGLLKLMSIESVMPSNHLILCRPLLFLPSIFPSIRVFSNKSALYIRWPKYWSFSFNISPSSEYSGLISFRMDPFIHLLTNPSYAPKPALCRTVLMVETQLMGKEIRPISQKNETEVQRELVTCWRLGCTYHEIVFGRHPNVKPGHLVFPATARAGSKAYQGPRWAGPLCHGRAHRALRELSEEHG